MNKKRVVITGLGVISSNGVGQDSFCESIFNGVSGIKPISLFDTSNFKAKTAGEIKDFAPQDFLGQKGLRTLDRSTKLISSAARLALDDSNITVTQENSSDIGVVIGTTTGSLSSICDFDKEAIIEGPRYVNPALFPNTVINSPASQVSIKFNIRGFNTTISTGFCASLDAINYAADFLRLGRGKFVLAGGVEELCIQTFLGFYKTGFLAGLDNGSREISCPFDKRRNGIIFGEGAGVLVLEDLDSAVSRQAKIYAEVLGFGTSFGAGLRQSMRMALADSDLKEDDIQYICAAANSMKDIDLMETEAIKDVFGNGSKEINISSIKSMTGEAFSASGSLQAVAAALAIDKQTVPPTINYEQKDPECDLNYVVNRPKSCRIDNVLINAFGGPCGNNSSLIISRFNN